jgi:hypothetical protein
MPWEFNPSIVLQGNLTQVGTLWESNTWSRTSRESNPSRHLVSSPRELNLGLVRLSKELNPGLIRFMLNAHAQILYI